MQLELKMADLCRTNIGQRNGISRLDVAPLFSSRDPDTIPNEEPHSVPLAVSFIV